jgi:hypothetical protein
MLSHPFLVAWNMICPQIVDFLFLMVARGALHKKGVWNLGIVLG